jgi:hypothetical protein
MEVAVGRWTVAWVEDPRKAWVEDPREAWVEDPRKAWVVDPKMAWVVDPKMAWVETPKEVQKRAMMLPKHPRRPKHREEIVNL